MRVFLPLGASAGAVARLYCPTSSRRLLSGLAKSYLP